MTENSAATELREGSRTTTMLNAHTHLTGGRLTARGLHDILLYHMVVSDLYAAGCPSGARLTEYPGWPSREEGALAPPAGDSLSSFHTKHELFLGVHDPPRSVRMGPTRHGGQLGKARCDGPRKGR